MHIKDLVKRVIVVLGLMIPCVSIASEFTVDINHSAVLFKVGHLGISKVYGRFNSYRGTLDYDKTSKDLNSVEFTVDANSVDTEVSRRDDHLRGVDFFNVVQYPEISFQSEVIQRLEVDKYLISGKLTLHGVTRDVSLTMTRLGEAIQRGSLRIGAEGGFLIQRSDFGMDGLLDAASDDVEIILAFEAVEG